jgi:hypothetical protein
MGNTATTPSVSKPESSIRVLTAARTVGGVAVIFAAGFGAAVALGAGKPTAAEVKDLFDNDRVAVHAITMPPGAQRDPRPRPTDELVLFYEEAHYQATEADGKVAPRDRKPGTVVWHKKGEMAPTLSNPGSKPVRYFSISIK